MMMDIKESMRDVDAMVHATSRLHDFTTSRHSARVRWLARSDSLRIWVLDRDAEGWDGRGVVSDH